MRGVTLTIIALIGGSKRKHHEVDSAERLQVSGGFSFDDVPADDKEFDYGDESSDDEIAKGLKLGFHELDRRRCAAEKGKLTRTERREQHEAEEKVA